MTVRVGIIGTGWGTSIQVPCFRAAGLEITALWARTPEKAARFAKEFGIPFHTADYREVVEHPEVDLVSIVTPTYLHAETALAALKAGKHVLCEKPTAMNAAEAEQMLAVAQEHPDLIALIDHELRFLSVRQKMHELIQADAIWKVFHVGTKWSSAGRLDPNKAWNWWSDSALGGGVLGAIGSHVIDTITVLTDSAVTSISADLRTFVQERPDAAGNLKQVTSDDYCSAQLKLAGEISGTIHMSVVTPGPGVHRITVNGSEGGLVLDGDSLSIFGPDGNEARAVAVEDNITIPEGVSDGSFARGTVAIGRALCRAIEDGDRDALAPAADFVQGLHLQRVMDAARDSAIQKTWADIS